MKVYEDRVAEITDAEAFRICMVPLDQGFQLANATVMNGTLMIAFRRVAIQAEVTSVVHTQQLPPEPTKPAEPAGLSEPSAPAVGMYL